MAAKRLFDEKEIRQISTLAGYGMNIEQIAAVMGVSKPTFERRQVDQPEVADGILKGRAQASANVRQTAYKMAVSGKSAVMTIFWLKCREGWKEPLAPADEGTPITLSYRPKALREAANG